MSNIAPEYTPHCPTTGTIHDQSTHQCEGCGAINPNRPYGSSSIGHPRRTKFLEITCLSSDDESQQETTNSAYSSSMGHERINVPVIEDRDTKGRYISSIQEGKHQNSNQPKNEAEDYRQKACRKNKAKSPLSAGDSALYVAGVHPKEGRPTSFAMSVALHVETYTMDGTDRLTSNTKHIATYGVVLENIRRSETTDGPRAFRRKIYEDLIDQMDTNLHWNKKRLHIYMKYANDVCLATKVGLTYKDIIFIHNSLFEKKFVDTESFYKYVRGHNKGTDVKVSLVYSQESEAKPEDDAGQTSDDDLPNVDELLERGKYAKHKRTTTQTSINIKKKIKEEPKETPEEAKERQAMIREKRKSKKQVQISKLKAREAQIPIKQEANNPKESENEDNADVDEEIEIDATQGSNDASAGQNASRSLRTKVTTDYKALNDGKHTKSS